MTTPIFNLPDRPATHYAFVCLVILLTAVGFSGLATHDFDADDYEWMADMAAAQKDVTALFSPNRTLAIRPVPDLVAFIGYQIWGPNPAAYHLLLVVLHGLNTLLLYYTFRRFKIDLELSFLASLLFLVNVTHFRAIHWIICLYYILALTFGLWALINFVRYLDAKHSRYQWMTAGLTVLAISCHPASISLLPFYIYLAHRRNIPILRAVQKTTPIWLSGILAVGAAYFASPESPQTHAVSETLKIGLLSKNLLWFTSRLITTAHGLLVVPNDTVTLMELVLGAAVCAGTFLLYKYRVFPAADWAILAILAVLPFINHPPPETRWFPAGPSRQLYLATAGSSLVIACLLRDLINGFFQTVGIRRLILTLVTAALIVSSTIALNRVEAVSLYTSGRSAIARQHLEKGGELLARALTCDAGLVPFDAYVRMAAASFTFGRSNLGILESGLKRYPDNPQLLLLAGLAASLHDNVFIRQKGEERIRKAFEQTGANFRQISLNASLACFNLGNHYMNTGRLDKAVGIYTMVLRLRPDYTHAMLNLGKTLVMQQKYQDAVAIYMRVAQRHPEHIDYLLKVANLLFAKNDLSVAFAAYQKIIETVPESAAADYARGILHYAQGDFTAAVQAFQSAAKHDPENPDFLLTLGQAYEQSGNLRAAIQAYQRVLILDPENAAAQQKLAVLTNSADGLNTPPK